VLIIGGRCHSALVAVDFETSIVFIKWICTHTDYDRIDVRTVQHGD
jgi:mRNA interferase HigB